MGKRIKRFITLFLALTLIITGSVPTSAVNAAGNATTKSEAKFKDIKGHKYEKSLNYAVDNGLLTSETNKINPAKKTKRADVIMAAVALLGLTAEPGNMKNIKDVKEGDVYYEAFSAAIAAGLIAPNKNGKLNPTYNATNDYVAKVFARVIDVDKDEMRALITYKKTMNRARFSKFLRTTFPNIITKDTTKLSKGNVVVNTPNVKLSGVKVRGKLIIGEGVGDGNVILDNVEVDGAMFVRTGSAETVSLTGNSTVAATTIKADELDVAEETPAGAPDDDKKTDDKQEAPVYVWIPGGETTQPTDPVDPLVEPIEGAIIANYGTPKLDGEVDDIWASVEASEFVVSSGSPAATGKVKVLWDDFALFFLAEVTDPDLSVSSKNAYEKDSVEVYLDENNDSVGGMVADNPDDIHFRVNYLNERSGDAGDVNRFSTATKVVDGGYVVEGRVAFINPITEVTSKVMGIEFSINDGLSNGSRAGTLNVYDPTGQAYANTALFGKVQLVGKTADSVPGLNIYDLVSLVNETKMIELERYTEATANKVSALLAKADAAIAAAADAEAADPTQAEVDQLVADIQAAVSALVRDNNKSFDDKECLPIPAEYRNVAENGGTIKTITYQSRNYGRDTEITEYMNVYLPYGYDAEDTETKYNTFYLVHGGGENWKQVFGGEGQNLALKNLLDHMIANGDIEPVIVVTPDHNTNGMFSGNYDKQIRNDVIPTIEKLFNVYVDDEDNGIVAREHRALGGFSMGSYNTWKVYEKGIDMFKYFVPSSMGYNFNDEKSYAATITDIAENSGVAKEDLYIFNCAGSEDHYGYNQHLTTVDIQENGSSFFTCSADLSKGNYYMIYFPGGTHHWTYVNRYLYNILPDLFFAENAKAKAAEENMVIANFGTPSIDGEIDAIWDKAVEVKAQNVIDNPTATASFKVLWDDEALYLLADVKDADLDATASQDHEKDSIEFFLDEFNENSGRYDSNDYQLRINYLNQISGTSGIANRVISKVKVTEGVGYVVEARITFLGTPKNYKISGTEFALNDASNGRRIGMLKGLGTTDNAYSTTNVFGKMMYMGKKYDDGTPVDFSALNAALESAASIDNEVSKYAAVAKLLSDCVDACEAAKLNEEITKEEVTALVNELKAVVSAINNLQSALNKATVSSDMYTAESVAALEERVVAAKEALAAESITVAELNALATSINTAYNALKVYYPEVAPVTAPYGYAMIDGKISEGEWDDAEVFNVYPSSSSPVARATFRVKWDENALYVLADVVDPVLGDGSSNVYEKDSIEIYLDEKYDHVGAYSTDDLHFRVNYKNEQSADDGDLNRFFTKATVKADGTGYIIEARISFLEKGFNGKVSGIEFSVNDAQGSSRIGTLNAFDYTGMAYSTVELLNKITFVGEGTPGPNPYDLANLNEEANEIWLDYYSNGNVVEEISEEVDALIAKAFDMSQTVTQEEIDALYARLQAAIDALVRNDNYSRGKEARRIPAAYMADAEVKGTLKEVTYATSHNADNRTYNKTMNVYLPAGYFDPANADKVYDVFYYVHGMGESQYMAFGYENNPNFFKNTVDHMMADGKLNPMIIVTPTWSGEDGDSSMGQMSRPSAFYNELFNDIIPYIDSNYRTNAVREHRALGGFSAGSMSLWSTYQNGGLDYFKYFVPISGSGSSKEEIAQLASKFENRTDYFVFGASGSEDMANSGLRDLVKSLDSTDQFVFNADLTIGNCYYIELQGGTHIFNCAARYLYNIMPDLFCIENGTVTPTDPVDPLVEPPVEPIEGAIVAMYGTPILDGIVDDIWDNVTAVPFIVSSDNPNATATVKVMWDNYAYFFLAQVNDPVIDTASGDAYGKDSVEVYLDEYNDSIGGMVGDNPDDIHFRANVLGDVSCDAGDLNRFTAAAKIVDGGYVIEGRVSFLSPATTAVNDKVCGAEFSVNDAANGARIGTLNVFDETANAYADTSLFGKVVFKGKTEDSVQGLNIFDLQNYLKEVNAIELERYTESTAKRVSDLVAQANEFIAQAQDAEAENPSQEAIDELLANLKAAVKALKHDTNKVFDDKECLPIPAEYRVPAEKAGHIETVEFAYSDNASATGMMNVYLPYGYDPEDKETKYNTFYMFHGMGENWTTIFGGEGKNYALKILLDHMIANGDIEPLIVITPGHDADNFFSNNLYNQLRNDIVPTIESLYNVYTDREHRATGGFSMGSNRTWDNYANCLDMFKYFVPSSFGFGFGGAYTQRITDIAENSGYEKEDIYLFTSAGTADNLGDSMRATADEIRNGASSFFTYSADLSKGNFYMIHFPGGTHHWTYVNRYLYNILPDLFFAENAKDKAAAENMVIANFGTPKIDGEIDEVWDKAVEIKAQNVIDNPQATATFKTLWDDEAIYVLAQVKDADLDASSRQDHEKDSIEFFLDEFNEKSRYSYDSNDYQLRINYLNQISGTAGIADRVTSQVKVIEGEGYVVEARITFLGLPKNYKVSGVEFSLNDASNGTRIGMLKALGTTDNAYQDPGVFGSLMYMGKKYDDTTSVDFTGLNKAIDAAKAVNNEVSETAAVAALLADSIAEAEAALANEEITKEAVKALVDMLNALVKAVNDIQSALTSAKAVDKAKYTAETVEALETSLAAVEAALTAESVTADEIISLGAALKAAVSGLKIYYPEVAPIEITYGSPLVDGTIDSVWEKAERINVYPSGNNPKATATFRALWDDNALYVLAEVIDPKLDSANSNVYEKDSIEIYLDEGYERTEVYGVDDLHFRVNYKNEQSADDGDLGRFTTAVVLTENGYIVEARISFLGSVENGKVSGIEFSLNDAENGSRIGNSNAFDFTGMAYSTTALFNKATFVGKEEGDHPSANIYDMLTLVEEANEIWKSYYTEESVQLLESCIAKAQAAIAAVKAGTSDATQEDIDAISSELNSAIKALVRNNNFALGKECRRIPTEYNYASDSVAKGHLEEVTYTTYTGKESSMMVYVPAGYDAADKDTKYNVFYYVHGNGESQYKVFGTLDDQTFFVNVLDHMIANGQLEPMIFVTPTWQTNQNSNNFYDELFGEGGILDIIETRYNTYADGTMSAQSRIHRALGGFSMGSMSLFSTYTHGGIDYFKYFVPISAGGSSVDEIASIASKYPNKTDYFFFGASGTEDMANSGLKSLIQGLAGKPEQFTYSADIRNADPALAGNAYYIELEGGTHIFNCAARYLYNILPDLFFMEYDDDADFGMIEIVDEVE